MKALLLELIDTISARGAMVVAADGMLIASEVREGVDHERLAALGAEILLGIGRRLEAAGLPSFTQVEVAAEEGKVILLRAGPTFLLVLLGARLEVGPGSIEIRSAAQRIEREATLALS
jgi:predicted regulator of Ras-like GTPase activity (Roadblock/LC7/MglB family)